MPNIISPQQPRLGSGVFITYAGSPNVCSYWEVVGIVAMSEVSPLGSIVHRILVTDNDGLAVNQYISPTDPGAVGAVERIKVSERA